MYLRVERRDEREHRHKLAAVAEGPYRVIEVKDSNVVIEKEDNNVERVSRSRVVLAPKPKTVEEIQEDVRPMTDEELDQNGYPVPELTNMRDLTRSINKTDDVQSLRRSCRIRQQTRRNEGVNVQTQRARVNRPRNAEMDSGAEYVIDKVVDHIINEDEGHPHAKHGDMLYKVRWFGYTPEDDTFEPVHHLPRSQVLSYHRRKQMPVPSNIAKAMLG